MPEPQPPSTAQGTAATTPRADAVPPTLDAGLLQGTIAAVKDDQMTQPWSLLWAGTALFTLPRATVMRTFVLNHLIHHRAILYVYLRLNNIPVPGMYDPSGVE